MTPVDPASIGSEVWYGKESGKYASVEKGESVVYSQLYPFEGLWNYTSGIIHHVKLEGMFESLFICIPAQTEGSFVWCCVLSRKQAMITDKEHATG